MQQQHLPDSQKSSHVISQTKTECVVLRFHPALRQLHSNPWHSKGDLQRLKPCVCFAAGQRRHFVLNRTCKKGIYLLPSSQPTHLFFFFSVLAVKYLGDVTYPQLYTHCHCSIKHVRSGRRSAPAFEKAGG